MMIKTDKIEPRLSKAPILWKHNAIYNIHNKDTHLNQLMKIRGLNKSIYHIL